MSSAPRMAVAEIAVSIPPSILIVDDDDKFLEGARDYFSSCGYDVATARTPEEATAMLRDGDKDKYQLIVTDYDFGDSSKVKGDEFARENRRLFGKAKIAIISGATTMTHEIRNQLQDAEALFLEKTPILNTKLKEITRQENEKLANVIEGVVKKRVASRIEKLTGMPVNIRVVSSGATGAATAPAPIPKREPAVPALSELAIQSMKRTLMRWLQSRGNLDEPVFAYGSHVYSANEMLREVENETEVGLDHIGMMLGEFEDSLEADDGTQQYDDDEL